jgi:hypothetical protein
MAVSPVLTLISRSDRVIFSLSPPFFVGDSKMSELRAKKAKETGYVTIFTKPLELGELPGGSARALRDLALPRADRRLIIHNQLAVSI